MLMLTPAKNQEKNGRRRDGRPRYGAVLRGAVFLFSPRVLLFSQYFKTALSVASGKTLFESQTLGVSNFGPSDSGIFRIRTLEPSDSTL